jgi:hypothetical protein
MDQTHTQITIIIHKQTKNLFHNITNVIGPNTYTNNNYHTQANKKSVSQYNKCNQVPPVLSSKDRLIKEPKDFTCEEVGLKIFSILSISFNVLIIITTLFSKPTIQSERVQINTKYM